MEELKFKLDAFEGPLDLLLHLVSKHKLNIYDIEISLLLEQYLQYIEEIESLDYELAADFFEMAARLIYIKTCYLLPQPEEAEELKKELQGKMIEYSLAKLAAQRLRDDYAGGLVFVRAPVKLPVNKQYTRLHDKQELYDAYMAIAGKVKNYTPLRANIFSPLVSKRIVSVESKISYVLERLYTAGHFDMSTLYDGMTDRSERIATFLAVLELAKAGNIYLNDDNTVISLRRTQDTDGEDNAEAELSDAEISDNASEIETDEEDTEGADVEEALDEKHPEITADEGISGAEEAIIESRSRGIIKTAQLALETAHTAALRLPEIAAIPAFAPMVTEINRNSSEPGKIDKSEISDRNIAAADELLSANMDSISSQRLPGMDSSTDEGYAVLASCEKPERYTQNTKLKGNYYGRRYYWRNALTIEGTVSYRAAVQLRI